MGIIFWGLLTIVVTIFVALISIIAVDYLNVEAKYRDPINISAIALTIFISAYWYWG